MNRDMELCRKFLFKIEEKYVDNVIFNLNIEGYSMQEVAYHCKLLEDAGLLCDYTPYEADNGLYSFRVGALTWEGHDFLDKIREDTIWSKTKDTIKEKGLPMIIDVIKQISAQIISSMTEGAIKSLIN